MTRKFNRQNQPSWVRADDDNPPSEIPHCVLLVFTRQSFSADQFDRRDRIGDSYVGCMAIELDQHGVVRVVDPCPASAQPRHRIAPTRRPWTPPFHHHERGARRKLIACVDVRSESPPAPTKPIRLGRLKTLNSLADSSATATEVWESALGQKPTFSARAALSAKGQKLESWMPPIRLCARTNVPARLTGRVAKPVARSTCRRRGRKSPTC